MANVEYQIGWYDSRGVGVTRALQIIPSGDAPIDGLDEQLAILRDAVQQSTGSDSASLIKMTTVINEEPIP